jgi:hypothetical protein
MYPGYKRNIHLRAEVLLKDYIRGEGEQPSQVLYWT